MRFFTFASIFLLTLSSLPAQAPAGEEEVPLRELSITTYARGKGDYRGLFIQTSVGNFQPLRVLRGSRSAPVNFRGTSDFMIFRRIATEDPENPWRYYPVASTTFPEREREFFLLITPRAGNGQNSRPGAEREFNIAVLPEIQNAVQQQQIAFFNGTGAQLIGVLGGEQIVLNPGLSRPFSISDFPPGEGILMGLTVRYEDSLRPVFHNHIQFSEDSRYIMVLLPPDQPGSFEIVAFRLTI